MLEIIAATIDEYSLLPTEGTVVVAVSGGADSLCLLHVLKQLCGPGKRYPQVQLHIAHLNHQLRGLASEQDAHAVAQLAQAWDIPITLAMLDVAALAQREHRSLEDAARQARYHFLREVAQGQPIAVAHHRDDQAETLVLHWLRGGGIASMVGLQPKQHDIIRPLLSIGRADTLAYCLQHALHPQEDASNSDTRYLRNRIRHEILPTLESINPGFRETLLRNAETMQIDLAWIQTQIDSAWPTVILAEQADNIQVNIPVLRTLSQSIQRHLLRRVTSQLCDGQSPLEVRHYSLLEQLQQRPATREPLTLHLPQQLHVLRQGDILVFKHISKQVESAEITTSPAEVVLSIPGQVVVPGTPWLATAEWLPEASLQQVRPALQRQDWSEVWRILPVTPYVIYIDAAMLISGTLLVRTRRAGDRIQPLGMRQVKKIKEIFIDRHVPRETREQLPLFFSETQCIWLGGVYPAHHVRLTSETQQIVRLSMQSQL
ncbi:tRNA lysidine(34) synthetase TilS [Dictyobacter arantiisoli]|uniref:tRNA(Ile)-lysidine synthase n=1 Tax=Dictyobacter arantiisoli TaxID=2014874 RepID=A0A5A5T6R2_9CHLR|nr:tRNA lysidine(34) synthetase TilS [Dictyobacter arantiisoli]GCF07160.1 tRNA(Ile)-lysidine synthase [Dictyobacter arantiisoli]